MADAHPLPAKTIRIGRQLDDDIALTGDLDVSRHHAELHYNPDGSFEIIDLRSHGGTYVNGKRITRKMLTEQDIISIGHAMFRLSNGELRQYANESAMTIADRLDSLGIELPRRFPPLVTTGHPRARRTSSISKPNIDPQRFLMMTP